MQQIPKKLVCLRRNECRPNNDLEKRELEDVLRWRHPWTLGHPCRIRWWERLVQLGYPFWDCSTSCETFCARLLCNPKLSSLLLASRNSWAQQNHSPLQRHTYLQSSRNSSLRSECSFYCIRSFVCIFYPLFFFDFVGAGCHTPFLGILTKSRLNHPPPPASNRLTYCWACYMP